MLRALEGVSVVEFSADLASAYAAMLLAEQGARVLKVEPPGGDPERGSPHFQLANRSKESICLQLADPGERQRARALISRADIVISGHAPGRRRALGLDYAALAAVNPRVLLLSMPPLGSRGPLADLQAPADLAQALGGIDGNQWARSGNPVALAFPLAAYEAGALGALAVVAALIRRGAEGPGQEVEVSMLAAAMALQAGAIVRNPGMIRPNPGGPADPLGQWAIYRLFEASDGQYLFVAPGNPRFWYRLALAVERPELISDPRFEQAPWIIDRDCAEALKAIMIEVFKQRPRDEWLRILRDNEIPCGELQTRQECFADPQVAYLGMRQAVNDPALGLTHQIGVPIKLHRTPGAIDGPAPRAGANQGALEALRAQPANIPLADPAHAGQGPLAGVLVVDLGGYIAGAFGPMLLGQLGATVLKIESLDGDPFRLFGYGFLAWNQGKRSLALDLRQPEGREIIYGLARQADIVFENMRPGQTTALGLDYATLARLNPGLIQMTITGFGSSGPGHARPGFDPLTQAFSGLMLAHAGYARSEPGPRHPLYLTCPVSDYGAGTFGALGCVLALAARQRLGIAQAAETSLLQSVMALQGGEFVFYPGRPNFEVGAPELRGLGALRRAYQGSDGGWLYLAVSSQSHWQVLCRWLNRSAQAYRQAAEEGPESELAAALAAHFGARPCADNLRRLAAAGIPAVPVNTPAQLFDDEQVRANELLIELSDVRYGPVGQVGAVMKFSRTPVIPRLPAPALGQHSDEILHEFLDYSPQRIAELRQRKIVR